MPTDTRSSASGNFSLELDGKPCGFLKSVDGGGIKADVISEPVGATGFPAKQIGPPIYEELAIQLGLDLEPAVYDWIAATWSQKFARKDGSVVSSDASRKARSAREFSEALVTETTIPALDASSKDPAFMTIKFAPEVTRSVKATGTIPAPKNAAQKKWLPANFRLELDGLDCSKVSKIDAFTVKVTSAFRQIGDERLSKREPGMVDFPNLSVTIAESGAQTWIDWFEEFVVKGKSDSSNEKSGAIVFLSSNRKDELGRVTLHNVGACAMRRGLQQAQQDTIARVTFELYCEWMELRIGPKAADPPQPAPAVRPKPVPVSPRVIR